MCQCCDLEQLFYLDALQAPKAHRKRGNMKIWGKSSFMDDGISEDSLKWCFCIKYDMVLYKYGMVNCEFNRVYILVWNWNLLEWKDGK